MYSNVYAYDRSMMYDDVYTYVKDQDFEIVLQWYDNQCVRNNIFTGWWSR